MICLICTSTPGMNNYHCRALRARATTLVVEPRMYVYYRIIPLAAVSLLLLPASNEREIFIYIFIFDHHHLSLLSSPTRRRFYPRRSSGQQASCLWSQVSTLLPPSTCLCFSSRIHTGFSIPTARRFSSNLMYS